MEAAWGGRRPERKLIARDDGHPMARDGPERSEGCQGRPVLPYGEDATLPRLRHDRLGGPMQRGRALFWTVIGSAVAGVAASPAMTALNAGLPPKTTPSTVPFPLPGAAIPPCKPRPAGCSPTSSTSLV